MLGFRQSLRSALRSNTRNVDFVPRIHKTAFSFKSYLLDDSNSAGNNDNSSRNQSKNYNQRPQQQQHSSGGRGRGLPQRQQNTGQRFDQTKNIQQQYQQQRPQQQQQQQPRPQQQQQQQQPRPQQQQPRSGPFAAGKRDASQETKEIKTEDLMGLFETITAQANKQTKQFTPKDQSGFIEPKIFAYKDDRRKSPFAGTTPSAAMGGVQPGEQRPAGRGRGVMAVNVTDGLRRDAIDLLFPSDKSFDDSELIPRRNRRAERDEQHGENVKDQGYGQEEEEEEEGETGLAPMPEDDDLLPFHISEDDIPSDARFEKFVEFIEKQTEEEEQAYKQTSLSQEIEQLNKKLAEHPLMSKLKGIPGMEKNPLDFIPSEFLNMTGEQFEEHYMNMFDRVERYEQERALQRLQGERTYKFTSRLQQGDLSRIINEIREIVDYEQFLLEEKKATTTEVDERIERERAMGLLPPEEPTPQEEYSSDAEEAAPVPNEAETATEEEASPATEQSEEEEVEAPYYSSVEEYEREKAAKEAAEYDRWTTQAILYANAFSREELLQEYLADSYHEEDMEDEEYDEGVTGEEEDVTGEEEDVTGEEEDVTGLEEYLTGEEEEYEATDEFEEYEAADENAEEGLHDHEYGEEEEEDFPGDFVLGGDTSVARYARELAEKTEKTGEFPTEEEMAKLDKAFFEKLEQDVQAIKQDLQNSTEDLDEDTIQKLVEEAEQEDDAAAAEEYDEEAYDEDDDEDAEEDYYDEEYDEEDEPEELSLYNAPINLLKAEEEPLLPLTAVTDPTTGELLFTDDEEFDEFEPRSMFEIFNDYLEANGHLFAGADPEDVDLSKIDALMRAGAEEAEGNKDPDSFADADENAEDEDAAGRDEDYEENMEEEEGDVAVEYDTMVIAEDRWRQMQLNGRNNKPRPFINDLPPAKYIAGKSARDHVLVPFERNFENEILDIPEGPARDNFINMVRAVGKNPSLTLKEKKEFADFARNVFIEYRVAERWGDVNQRLLRFQKKSHLHPRIIEKDFKNFARSSEWYKNNDVEYTLADPESERKSRF